MSSNYEGPTKVNIGCGSRLKRGYENVDVRKLPGVRQFDLRKRWPYPDSVLDEVLAEDVLEHFSTRILVEHVLPEIHRCLKEGGALVIQMPDLVEIVRHWQSGKADDETTSMRIHGRQDYPENTHYASYTDQSMWRILKRVGFVSFRRVETRNWNMVLRVTK